MLDTNACIDFLDARSEAIALRIDANFGRLCISSITAGELLVGSRHSSDPKADEKRINVFLAGVVVVDFDLGCARRYGEVIRSIGVRRKSFERLIGVQALEHGHTLVTRNEKDFADVPGLALENWSLPL